MKNNSILFLVIFSALLVSMGINAQQPMATLYGGDGDSIFISSQTLESIEDYEPNPANMEFSKYGGWKAHRTTATGFFRVEKIDGRWWSIDPEGYYYIHKALNSVNTSDDFTNDQAHDILDDNGFNGMGNWSNEETIESSLDEAKPLAYCPRYSFIAEYRRQRSPRIEMPVFDDEFRAFCIEQAKVFEKYVDDPQVFGYFSDNELSWKGEGLPAHLELTDRSDKNYITAINFLESRGKSASNWDIDDHHAYMALMAEAYYSVVSEAIKAVDPNHMYLGSRCHSEEKTVEAFLRNAGKYVDIFSNNHYSKWSAREFEVQNMTEWSGRPLMMTEFYAMEYSSDFPSIGAGFKVETQGSRGLLYQNFVSTLSETGAVVGFHWFKFQDDDNGNKGVVNRSQARQGTVLGYMKEMNNHLYDYIDYVDSKPEPDVVLTPEADAYYQGNTNFNNEELLSKFTTNNQFLREAYIKFDLSSLTGEIDSAEIKLFTVNTGSEISNYQAELVTDDSWSESAITSANSPDGSKVLQTWSDGGDITINVTEELLDALDDNNKLSIRVVGTLNNNKTSRFGSSEHPNPLVHPKLMVYNKNSNTPPPTDGTLVHITKRNAPDFAIDGGTGGTNGQNVTLSRSNTADEGQLWVEIDRGNGYYSYEKFGTNYSLDGGNGGATRQSVYLWQTNATNQNQQWQKQAVGDGGYKLIKRNASGFAVNGGSGGREGHDINLYDSSNPSQNLQWFITPVNEAEDARIEAEDYDSMSGIQTEASTESGDNVGYINNGDWIRFDDVNLSGITNMDARVATRTGGGTIEVRTGSVTGTLIGSIDVSNTGGYQNWTTLNTSISNASGTQDVYLVFTGGNGYLFNVNWVEFNTDSRSNKDIDEVINLTSDVIIYPNPVISTTTIKSAANSIITIYDMNSSIILKQAISSDSEILDLSLLSTGVYFAEVKGEETISMVKLVKE